MNEMSKHFLGAPYREVMRLIPKPSVIAMLSRASEKTVSAKSELRARYRDRRSTIVAPARRAARGRRR